MIDELHVENLALIKDATFAPSCGMTVITGETGAGKTALLSACRLIMGQRADKDMVRMGAASAEIEARLFEGSDEIVVSRSVSADGKSRVKIDGKIASVGELSEKIGASISLCSQHDQVLLTKSSMHRQYFDEWAKIYNSEEMKAYKSAFEAERLAQEFLEQLQDSSSASEAKIEEARFVLKQIEAIRPSEADYNELLSSAKKAENAETLARASSQTHDALSGEQGVLDLLNASVALLEGAEYADSTLGNYARTLRDALYSIEDVARDVSCYAEAFEFDASNVEFMQERIASYQSLMRAYGPDIASVVKAEENARAIVEACDGAGEALNSARAVHEEACDALRAAAKDLHKLRSKAAPKFSTTINGVLTKLAMGESKISCEVILRDEDDWNETGPDSVEFLFTPAIGMQSRPLSKIASGGELGRVMLALHAVMGREDSVSTLVFDEVDVGVGGKVASDIADLMAEIANTHQVIVVTHSAQIAAMADKHYIAKKEGTGKTLETILCEANGAQREKEIARMLSGSLSQVSLEHARELLAAQPQV